MAIAGGWAIPPYNPQEVVENKSSRALDHTPVTQPRYHLEADKELQIHVSIHTPNPHLWAIFTNTGREVLRDLRATIPTPFKIHTNIPKVLRPSESFRVKISFFEDKNGSLQRTLLITNERQVFQFVVSGSMDGNLLYNGDAFYSGKYTY